MQDTSTYRRPREATQTILTAWPWPNRAWPAQECQALEQQLGHDREKADLLQRLDMAAAAHESSQRDLSQQLQVCGAFCGCAAADMKHNTADHFLLCCRGSRRSWTG